jgi:hypothetical protein
MTDDALRTLARTDPGRLLGMLPEMAPTRLTFAAEYLGEVPAEWRERAVVALAALVVHPHVVVREGAAHGLNAIATTALVELGVAEPEAPPSDLPIPEPGGWVSMSHATYRRGGR